MKLSYIQAVKTYRGQGQMGSQTQSDREEQRSLAVGEEMERKKAELVQQELRRRSEVRGQEWHTQEEGVGD